MKRAYVPFPRGVHIVLDKIEPHQPMLPVLFKDPVRVHQENAPPAGNVTDDIIDRRKTTAGLGVGVAGQLIRPAGAGGTTDS
jgi:hypothetical protein